MEVDKMWRTRVCLMWGRGAREQCTGSIGSLKNLTTSGVGQGGGRGAGGDGALESSAGRVHRFQLDREWTREGSGPCLEQRKVHPHWKRKGAPFGLPKT